jgi:hypothetical protein
MLRIRDVLFLIPDPDPIIFSYRIRKNSSRIRIPGVKKHRIPDPKHCMYF